jgi:hypothetical protein
VKVDRWFFRRKTATASQENIILKVTTGTYSLGTAGNIVIWR